MSSIFLMFISFLEIIKILWAFFTQHLAFLVLKIQKIVRTGNYNAKNINQCTTG